MNHQLERVGLHQLGHRSVAERDIAFADLARDVTLRRSDRTFTGSERRIDAPQAISCYTERQNRGAGQNHLRLLEMVVVIFVPP